MSEEKKKPEDSKDLEAKKQQSQEDEAAKSNKNLDDPKYTRAGYSSEYTNKSWDPNSLERPHAKKKPEKLNENVLKQAQYNRNNYSRGPIRANNYNRKAKASKPTNTVFVVLLTILITAVITGFLVWNLSKNGILPGTIAAKDYVKIADDGDEIEGLGLSIHTDDEKAHASANKLAQIVDLIESDYYKVLSPSEIIEAMSEGVLDSLESPYTYYLSSEEYSDFIESISGNYSGIGAGVRQEDDGAYVIQEVYENSPAEKAGLKVGDEIIKVNDVAAESFEDPSKLAEAVRGKKGTNVILTVLRDGKEEPVKVTRGDVLREVVHVRMLNNEVGYMHIAEFTENLPEQFEAGIKELNNKGAKEIVFDLRFNPGGSAKAVQDVLDMLLDETTLASIKGRDDGESYTKVWKSEDGKLVSDDMHYAILVNEATASASELFSGSLRDNGKAIIIGQTTFGKGSGTRTQTLVDGSAANITVFNYFLPNGDLIEGEGLKPDVETDGLDLDLLKEHKIYELTVSQDQDLKAALKALKAE